MIKLNARFEAFSPTRQADKMDAIRPGTVPGPMARKISSRVHLIARAWSGLRPLGPGGGSSALTSSGEPLLTVSVRQIDRLPPPEWCAYTA